MSSITLATFIKQVKALRKKCNMLEREVSYLKTRCETHENLSNRNREAILKIHARLNTVDTKYNGESFDLAQ